MKKHIYYLTILFSTISFSQELSCCATVSEIKEALLGQWYLKGSENNDIHEFTYEEGEGLLKLIVSNKNEEKEHNNKNEPLKSSNKILNNYNIDIHKEKDGFYFIDITAKFGGISYRIFELTDKKLIHEFGNEIHEYHRILQ